MTHYLQLIGVFASIAGLLWIIAGLLASVGEPEYEDEVENQFPESPGLPHHRVKK